MTVHYQTTVDDYVRFQRHHFRKHPDGKRKMFRSRLRLVAACLIWFVVALSFHDTFFIIASIVMAVFFWFCFQPLWLHFTADSIKNLKKDSENRALFSETTLTLKPEGISMQSEESEGSIKWNIIQQIIESPTHVYIYLSTVNALIIPRRAFTFTAEYEQFVETARQYRENAVGLVI